MQIKYRYKIEEKQRTMQLINDVVTAEENDPLIVRENNLNDNEVLSNDPKIKISITYLLTIGACGMAYAALGATLDDVAGNFGKDSTDVGTVFIASGVGAIFGAIVSSVIFSNFEGNTVIIVNLFAIAATMMTMPFCNSEILLNFLFLSLGFSISICITGCSIMIRKIHGKKAGPWFGANAIIFGVGGCIAPITQICTPNIIIQYVIWTSLVLGVMTWAITGPNPEQYGRITLPKNARGENITPPHFKVEFAISVMLFWIFGGWFSATVYLKRFIEETSIIASDNKAFLLLVLWQPFGRIAGIADQTQVTNRTLPIHLGTLLFVGGVSIVFMLVFKQSALAVWFGIAIFGLCNSPCASYCHDWNNRLTYPTEMSMSILMLGVNLGATLVPYLLTVVWNHTALGPYALPYVMMLSMTLPIPFLSISSSLRYELAVISA